MGFYVKSDYSTWQAAKNLFVKSDYSTWAPIKKMFVKTIAGIWQQFWPKSGPQPTTYPYFASTSGGSAITSANLKTTIYAHNGTWDANGYTISGYSWSLDSWSDSTNGVLIYNILTGTLTTTGNQYTSLSLTTSGFDGVYTQSNYDKSYLAFSVDANTTSGVTGSATSDGNGYRLYIKKVGITKQGGSTDGDVVLNIGDTINYTGLWKGDEAYCPDNSNGSIAWYKSLVDLSDISGNVSVSDIQSYATLVTIDENFSVTGDGTTYTVSSSYTTSIANNDGNYYFYIIDSQYNSSDTGFAQQTAMTTYCGYPPEPTVYPTISATPPSGYYKGTGATGFMPGSTITGNTGQWSPTPDQLTSAFMWSTSSNPTGNGNLIYTSSGSVYPNTASLVDFSQNQNHSFTLPDPIYNSTGTSYPVSGKYLQFTVSAKKVNSYGYAYSTAAYVYDAPVIMSISAISATASDKISFSYTNSPYTGYAYSIQLQYSTNNSTWTTLSPTYTLSATTGTFTNVSVPSTTSGYYYRLICYNADNVYTYSTSTYLAPSYTFASGNTLYFGTNGYIDFDSGYQIGAMTSVLGKALAFLPGDMYTDSLSYAATSSHWQILWQGRRYTDYTGGAYPSGIKIEIWIPFNSSYAYVAYTIASGMTGTLASYSIGYWVDGNNVTSYTGISSGQQAQIYFSGTQGTVSPFLFSPHGSTWGGWLPNSFALTGTQDDGYYTMTTFSASSPSAPTSVSNSSVTSNSATVSWNAPVSNGGSQILSYDYSFNQSTWISSGFTGSTPNTSVSLTGLNPGTSYTVYVRANNYGGITGTNYGSTTFSTIAVPVNTVAPTITTNNATNTKFGAGNTITINTGTWTGAQSYSYKLYWRGADSSVTTSDPTKTLINTNQYQITVLDAYDNGSGAKSFWFMGEVTAYSGAGQTGASTTVQTAISSQSFIDVTSTISVGTATANGFTISGSVSSNGLAVIGSYAMINNIYIYNSSQVLTATITSASTPTIDVNGNWSYTWSGGTGGTTYYAKVNVKAYDTAATQYTSGFSSSITTTSPPVVNSNPSLSGSGVASTSLSASNGSYTGGTIAATAISKVYTAGTYSPGALYTSAPGTSVATPYTVTVADGTPTVARFQAYNRVTGNNGTTYYVFGSEVVGSMPTISTPTVTHTAGTSTYSASSSTTPAGIGTITYYWCVSNSSTTTCTFTSGSAAPSGTTAMWSGGTIISAVSSSGALSTGYIAGRWVHCMAVTAVTSGTTWYVRSSGVSHTAE